MDTGNLSLNVINLHSYFINFNYIKILLITCITCLQWLTHHHEVHQRFLKTSPYLAHSFCHNSPHCLLSTLHSSDSLKNYLGPLSENNPLINFTSHLSRAILRYQNLKWNVRQGRTNIVYYLYVESLTSQTHSKVVVTRDWRVGDMVRNWSKVKTTALRLTSSGDPGYSMAITANNTVLCIWKLLRAGLKYSHTHTKKEKVIMWWEGDVC